MLLDGNSDIFFLLKFFMGFILSPLIGIAVNGFILFLLTELVDGVIYTGGLKFFIIGGLIIGLVNFFIRPILKAVSLPLVLITGGMFLIVINVFILWFLAYFIDVLEFQGVTLYFSGVDTYIIGAIVFGVINWITHLIVK